MKANAEAVVERNAAIIADRNGTAMTWAEIAKKHKVSERTARGVYQRKHDEDKLEVIAIAHDPLGYIAKKCAEWKAMRIQLVEVAEDADNGNAKVGAMKAIIELHVRELNLLKEVGALPHDLGAVRTTLDVTRVSEAMSDLIEKFVPKKLHDDAENFLIDALNARLPSQSEPLELTQ